MKPTKIFSFLVILILATFFLAGNIEAAVPNPITDLNCVFSGISGAVWLTWSRPSGSPTSYDVRDALSAINSSDFNNASQFEQSWSGLANQGLVNYLTQEKTWFFAVKAINASGTSAISNITYCYVSKTTDNSDKTPPASSIIDPQNGSNILADRDYIVKGTSSDTGGSSVKQVEISLDGGNAWQKVTPKESIGTGFGWEYVWPKPSVGSYLIKTRATDWWDNKETPGAGINVKVITELPTVKPPTVEKPIQEMSMEELKAKIVEIQEKIIQLLQQLINLIQLKIKTL